MHAMNDRGRRQGASARPGGAAAARGARRAVNRRRLLVVAAAALGLRAGALRGAQPRAHYTPRGPAHALVPVIKRLELAPGESGPRVQTFAPLGPLRVEGFEVPEDQSPLADSFIGELGVFYGFGLEQGIVFANALDLKGLGIAREGLRELAVANYRRRYPHIGLERLRPGLYLVTEGGDLESSVLLDAVFWERHAHLLAGDPIVAAPARDVVLCSGSKQPGIAGELRKLAGELVRKAAENRLTADLYARRGGRWEILSG